MNPEYKKYILENINAKSIGQISQDLNIRESKVKKFLQRQKRKKRPPAAQKTTTRLDKRAVVVSVILIIIVGFAVYLNSLGGVFLWDDEDLVKNNIYLRNSDHLVNIFTKGVGAGVGKRGNFYRPLQITSYMIDYFFWRLDVRGYHLTNILLHVLTALAIFWFVTVLFGDVLLSFITGVLFVVHPVHTEAITYISGRADSLALLFMVLCLIFYIKHLGSGNKLSYIATVLSYVLAILSKEFSFVLLMLLLLFYHYTFKKRFRLKLFLPIVTIASIYILLRVTALKSLLPDMASCPHTVFQRIPGFLVAITNYVKLLILPFNLHMWYGNGLFAFTHPKALSGIVILFLLWIYGLNKRNSDKLVFFSIFWFFLALLPVSNLYPINAYMAEHWLYVPSLGFFLLIAKFFCHMYRTKNIKVIIIIFIMGLVSFYSYLTVKQNVYWQNPLTFYERTLKYSPDNKTIYNNLAIIYFDSGRQDEAIELFNQAIEIDPGYVGAYYNLGKAYNSLGNYRKASFYYKKVLEFDPEFVTAYDALGLISYSLSNHSEAAVYFHKAIEVNPDYARAYNNLGITQYALGNYQQAITWYKKAIALDPHFADAHGNLGLAYYVLNRDNDAIFSLTRAIELNPNDGKLYSNLAIIYFYQKQYKSAVEYFNKAKALGFVNPGLSRMLEPYLKQ